MRDTSSGGRCLMSALVAGALIIGGAACGRAEEAPRKVAPAFALAGVRGEMVQLSDYRGRVVILDFWATWCPPCREEIPHFIALQERYSEQGVTIIGVSVDQGGPQTVAAFAETLQINYPLAMADNDILQAYGGIRGIPTTFVIDRQGRIVKKYVGYQDPSVFERDIQALL